MNRKWIWISLTVLVVLLTAAVVGLQIWYNSPGSHVVGGQIKVQLEATGYIIDGDTGEIIGQTPVSVNGVSTGSDGFDGDVLVLGYQNVGEGVITETKKVERTDSGFYMIQCLESCVHQEMVNEQMQSVEHICEYYYTYYLYPKKPKSLVVCVGNFDERKLLYVVCADSETEALEEYGWFMENKPE